MNSGIKKFLILILYSTEWGREEGGMLPHKINDLFGFPLSSMIKGIFEKYINRIQGC